MIRFANLHDGQITCPFCSNTVKVNRTKHGATYVHKWSRLTPRSYAFLSAWFELDDTPVSKPQLAKLIPNITQNAVNGRVSELYGLGIADKENKIDSKSDPHTHNRAPRYFLTPRAKTVFYRAGKLF